MNAAESRRHGLWAAVCFATALVTFAAKAVTADEPAGQRLAIAPPEVSESLQKAASPGVVTDYLMLGAKRSKRYTVTTPGSALRQVVAQYRAELGSGLAPKDVDATPEVLGADRLLILKCARDGRINRVTASVIDLSDFKTVGTFRSEQAGGAAQVFLAVEDVWEQVERAGLPVVSSWKELKVDGLMRGVFERAGEPNHYYLGPKTLTLATRRENNDTLPVFSLIQGAKDAELDFRVVALTGYELTAAREQLAKELNLPLSHVTVEPLPVCRSSLRCRIHDIERIPPGMRELSMPVRSLTESTEVHVSVDPKTAELINALVTGNTGILTELHYSYMCCAETTELRLTVDWDAAYDAMSEDPNFRGLISRYRSEEDLDGKALVKILDRLAKSTKAKGNFSLSLVRDSEAGRVGLTYKLVRMMSYRLIADYIPPGAGSVEEVGVMKPRGEVISGKEEIRITYQPIVLHANAIAAFVGLGGFTEEVRGRLIKLK
jgi:hypothetical protein